MELNLIDKNYIKLIKELLGNGSLNELNNLLTQLHPEDLVVLINQLSLEEQITILSQIEREMLVKVLVNLDEPTRDLFFESYTPAEIANEFIEHMDSDDAAFVLAQLPEQIKDEVLSNLNDITYASQLLALLNYKENTAGSLMAVELVKTALNASVQSCIEEIRTQAENVNSIYVVYVVDEFERLVGLITLKNLILASPDALIAEVCNKQVISVSTSASIEEISNITRKYDLVVLPVVDAIGRLVGRITVDDVVEIMHDEADEDYQLMSGITEDVVSTDKVWILSRARLPWLIIGLFGGIASSRFLELYEDQIRIHPEMAFFMPLIAAMGGNAGVQSSAIVVQGLVNDTLGSKNIIQKILKESRVALLNGLICSAIILIYGYFFAPNSTMSGVVSLALMTVIVFASIFGTMVPMLLHKLKIDPAIATGPFITTTNDLLGIAIYFSLGHFFYQPS
jgi:magnesium transporter